MGVLTRDQSQAFALDTERGVVIALMLGAALLALPTTVRTASDLHGSDGTLSTWVSTC